MAYFSVDDQFHGHPKRRKAGWAAVGLWTVAGSWCRAYKSDGFIPAEQIVEWRAGRIAAQLVAAGLWYPDHEGDDHGFRFHDWHDIHDAADQIEVQRDKGRERQRKRRAKIREQLGVDL